MKRPSPLTLFLLLAAILAGGCDRLGIKDPARVAAEREAEGKAIGAGCRHAGRSLEDCYSLNDGAQKASVFAGWREMNDYMAANNIAAVPSQLAQSSAEAFGDGSHPDAKGKVSDALLPGGTAAAAARAPR